MISTDGGVGRALSGRSRRYDQALVGVAAACLGLLGLMALSVTPLLVVAVLPPAVVLCRLGVQVSRLERAATRDGITGLFNSNGWRALAESVVVRGDRSVGIGVLMIDLDHFKSINDTYGHLAGNAVLDAVASAIVRSIRDKDTAGRFGRTSSLCCFQRSPRWSWLGWPNGFGPPLPRYRSASSRGGTQPS